MDLADTIAIIISIVSLVISAFFTFWHARPHIKVEYYGGCYDKEKKSLTIAISYHNSSPVAGCIKNAYILYQGKKINCIQANETFDTTGITLRGQSGQPIIVPEDRLRTPISVEPFRSNVGVFIFPIGETSFFPCFNVYYEVVGRKKCFHLPVLTLTAND